MIGTRHPNHEMSSFNEKINEALVGAGFKIQSDLNYPLNLVEPSEGSGVGIFIDSFSDCPAYTSRLGNAFNIIGYSVTFVTNSPGVTFDPNEGIITTSNMAMVFIFEKP